MIINPACAQVLIAMCFIFIVPFITYSTPVRPLGSFQFHRLENRCTGRLRNFPTITSSGSREFKARPANLQTSCFFCSATPPVWEEVVPRSG